MRAPGETLSETLGVCPAERVPPLLETVAVNVERVAERMVSVPDRLMEKDRDDEFVALLESVRERCIAVSDKVTFESVKDCVADAALDRDRDNDTVRGPLEKLPEALLVAEGVRAEPVTVALLVREGDGDVVLDAVCVTLGETVLDAPVLVRNLVSVEVSDKLPNVTVMVNVPENLPEGDAESVTDLSCAEVETLFDVVPLRLAETDPLWNHV